MFLLCYSELTQTNNRCSKMTEQCAVRLAEINNDTQTDAQEQAAYNDLDVQYSYILNRLLSGKKVYTFSASFSLADILEGLHVEFEDLVNQDHDFMYEYRNGGLDKSLRQLIESEAHRIAQSIVG